MVIDPVCGKEVDPDEADERGLYSDCCAHEELEPADENVTRYYFCSMACPAKLERAPSLYTSAHPGEPPQYNEPEPGWS